jgi:predicted secreted Zn-dependent protease
MLHMTGRLSRLVVVGTVVLVQACSNPRRDAGAALAELAQMPNTTVDQYSIYSINADDIRSELKSRTTADDSGGAFHARTRRHYKWSWNTPADEPCTTRNAMVTFTAKVRLPKLANPQHLDEAAKEKWDVYHLALIEHETAHVTIGLKGRASVIDAIHTSTCSNANETASAAVDVVRQRNLDYDQDTNHGAHEGAMF